MYLLFNGRDFIESLVFEEGAVVGVALLDAEMAGQHVGGIDGVAGEGDVAEVEFVALVDFDFHFEAVLFGLLAVADVELILRDGIDGVGEDTGITVAVPVLPVYAITSV